MAAEQKPEAYPCPFCGCRMTTVEEERQRKEWGNIHYFVRCADCRATGPHRTSRRLAIVDWSEMWWLDAAIKARKKQAESAPA